VTVASSARREELHRRGLHERRRELEKVLYRGFGIEHTTLQVDHVGDHAAEGPRLQFLPRIEKQDTR
jgi:cobalt-zinc-cadmium efflux system protein